ncbi:MAG: SUMF1/EgtB/PvdO family nonheme iron enzyme [Mycobacteriales bacterium]
MGSDRYYPEERPAHEVHVSAFAIAEAPVTVAQFAAFVDATGHVTTAELPPPGFDVPAGSAVFTPPAGPVDLADPSAWWSWVPGACWRHPTGPGSEAAPDHPVVQVSYGDARAYCAWAGVTLPTEAQWERAAQGAHCGEANVWHGAFPWQAGGLGTTSPVGTWAPNPLGLVDAVGNVWEWTSDPWSHDHTPRCCAPAEDPLAPGVALRVAKGGSFLCSEDYCARYRPAARMAMAEDSPSCHLGFRVAC